MPKVRTPQIRYRVTYLLNGQKRTKNVELDSDDARSDGDTQLALIEVLSDTHRPRNDRDPIPRVEIVSYGEPGTAEAAEPDPVFQVTFSTGPNEKPQPRKVRLARSDCAPNAPITEVAARCADVLAVKGPDRSSIIIHTVNGMGLPTEFDTRAVEAEAPGSDEKPEAAGGDGPQLTATKVYRMKRDELEPIAQKMGIDTETTVTELRAAIATRIKGGA